MLTVDKLIELAKEVENEDPIDWGMLSISEDDAYRLIAMSVLDRFSSDISENNVTAMLATMTKLIVENMVLNIKLLNRS